jgi:hypothetical protein
MGFVVSCLLVLVAAAPYNVYGQVVTQRDSAGVKIIMNGERGSWTSRQQWQLEEVLRIGAVDGDPRYVFGRIDDVAVGTDGRIYVRDGLAKNIRVFDSSGGYDNTLGRPGFGPGEFMGPGQVFLAPGDTVLAPDLQNGRINRYGPDGSVLPGFRITLIDDLHAPLTYRVSPSGTIFAQLAPFGVGQFAAESLDMIVAVDSDGSYSDTVLVFPSQKRYYKADGPMTSPMPFGEGPIWTAASGNRVIYGVNSEYQLSVFSITGQLEKIIGKSHDKEKFRDEDRSVIEGFWAKLLGKSYPESRLARTFAVLNIPEFYPAMVNVLTGPDNTIWAQRFLKPTSLSSEEQERYSPRRDYGSPEWEVFDSSGTFLGVVVTPRRFELHTMTGDRACGALRGEVDVEYVVCLLIVRGT